MTAATPRTTTSPRSARSRLASSSCIRRCPTSRQNTRPAKRVAGQKTAPRIFFAAPSKTHPETATQSVGTHLESVTYVYDFAPGCAVAPNSEVGGARGLFSRLFGPATPPTINSAGVSVTTQLRRGFDPATGRFVVSFTFGFPAGADGVAMQMITKSNAVLDANGQLATPNGSPISTRSYWEAFPVANGHVVGAYDPSWDDRFQNAGWTNADSGTYQKSGLLQFYPGASLSDFPNMRPHTVPDAGDLPSSWTQPAGWTQSGGANHGVSVTFQGGQGSLIRYP